MPKSVTESAMSYMDDEVMLQEATSLAIETMALQDQLNNRLEWAILLNVRFSPYKAEVMHLMPINSKSKPNDSGWGISLYGTTIKPQKTIKSLGIWIDQSLSFKAHATAASLGARISASTIAKASHRKGRSLNTICHLISTATIPGMLWGCEAWWTRAMDITSKLGPAQHSLAQDITDLPQWTPIRVLLREAGHPPLLL